MPDIQHAIQIAAMPDAVYPHIASAEGFTHWWAQDVTEAGGAVELGFFNRSTLYRLRLRANQPPLHVEWSCESGDQWSGTRLIFQLEARGDTTLLRFTHADWSAATDYFVACTTTWGELMFRLKSAAEGKSRGPLFLASEMAY